MSRRRSRRPAWWRELVPLGKGRRRRVKHLASSDIPGSRRALRVIRRATYGLR